METSIKLSSDGKPISLVQYDEPVNLGRGEEAAAMTEKKVPFATATKGASPQLDEILNSVLPAKTWKSVDDSTQACYVKKTPASRADVIALQEQLDKMLIERQARDAGICPVREDLYSQGFDELIRQITINCPERGLLLLRVRDEIRMTIDAYKTLYDSSVTFGVRKQLQSEQGVDDMEAKIKDLTDKKVELTNTVAELRDKVEVIEKREGERRALDQKRRKEEVEFLKYQGQHFDQFLKSVGGK